MKKAFTLIEILIVVSILGILSAIVFPEFQAHAQQSREAAAKDTLRILRNAIELYAGQHNSVAPGYQPSNPSNAGQPAFYIQMVSEYLSDKPKNPFNGRYGIIVINSGEVFPAAPLDTDMFGWIYEPATKTIKLNWSGTDSEGNAYFDY